MNLKVNDVVTFKATDINDKDININKNDKVTVLSIYPAINTKICDLQTKILVELAQKFKDIEFISLSLDPTSEISSWCGANSSENISIISDLKYNEFTDLSGLKIEDKNALKRGLIILDEENKVIDFNINENYREQADFDWLQHKLTNI